LPSPIFPVLAALIDRLNGLRREIVRQHALDFDPGQKNHG